MLQDRETLQHAKIRNIRDLIQHRCPWKWILHRALQELFQTKEEGSAISFIEASLVWEDFKGMRTYSSYNLVKTHCIAKRIIELIQKGHPW